jgi:hypothetical protein
MNARANCNDSARGCGRGDDKRVVSNGVQSTTKQIQTGWQEGLEPYIRSPPRVTNYGALLLGYVGCLFSARDGGRLRWTGMNLVLAPDLLLSLARQRGEG